jgi:hypothetical protein
MAQNRRKLRAGLAAFLAFSLFVCVVTGGASARAAGRQIEFTPHVSPMALTQTAQAMGFGTAVAPTAVPEGAHIPISDSAWIVQGLTSEQALALCSNQWGSEEVGICVAPGGTTYYVWIEPGTVMEVMIDANQVWQEHFIDAVGRIVQDLDSIEAERSSQTLGGIAVALGGVGVLPGCATIIGCLVAVGAFVGGLTEITASESTIDRLEVSVCEDTRSAVYNYCMIQGLGDAVCRETAGYGEPCAPCPPRAVCPP